MVLILCRSVHKELHTHTQGNFPLSNIHNSSANTKQYLGWRVQMYLILYSCILCTFNGGMQEWVTQIPVMYMYPPSQFLFLLFFYP